MHSTGFFLTTLLALFGLAIASPLEPRVPSRYKLKTTVLNGKNDTGTPKGNLWVVSYHTGAGLGDATLDKNKTVGNVGYLNNTEQLFSIGDYQWPLGFSYEPYAAWAPVTISVASVGTYGFFINSTGLHSNYSSTAGWLACDWWHGVPQLFWTSGYYNDNIPKSCSTVKLDVVGV